MRFNKTLIQETERTITQLIKDEITRLGLVDTGRMRDSIKTTAKVSKNSFTFSVEAVDYFKYLDGDYNIVNNVVKSNQYNKVLDLVEQLYVDAIEDSIK